MPVYEYACEECGERFELFLRSVSATSSPICPHCGSADVHKAISLFGVAGASSTRNVPASAACGPGPV
jgi:putative FmdB family regulatory protein